MTTIDTGRLLLRHFTVDDVQAIYLMNSIPEVVRYVGNTPISTLDEAKAILLEGPLHDYATYGFGRFACVWKESGEVIGFSGLKFIPELDAVELGYRLLPPFWGRGLATEAGRASIDYARDALKLKRLIGLVHPENAGSANVMRKLGFAVEGKARLDFIEDADLDLYARGL
ncbi:MAG TPA: GNAT family N-acetyltransferase [Paucimonas sp.]|nr:GNAT family N-acetyltransferase [Paucimonas sp.]